MSGNIDVIVTVNTPLTAEERVRRALPGSSAVAQTAHVSLDSAQVEENIIELINKFGNRLLAPPPETQPFQVDEIELSLSIDAKGKVSLIGSFEVGGHAGIKVKLKRKAVDK
ncbi:hypothetical protein [Rhizobium leguminosarum]|uniref:Pepco domain-containing protein n=1 Tax=Rhizobium leguminosarum TaxID=384 RepID=UPI001C910B71|nr:hypothetical protein [Rhizobium leguminosarum]MBY3003897.1 hypothetical protein [Rhizobium leguminosarum]